MLYFKKKLKFYYLYYYVQLLQSVSTAQMTSIQLTSVTLSVCIATAGSANKEHKNAKNILADARVKYEEAKENALEADRVRARFAHFADLRAKDAMRKARSRSGAKARWVSDKAAAKARKSSSAFFQAHISKCEMNSIYQDKAAALYLRWNIHCDANLDHAYALYAFWEAQKVRDNLEAESVLERAEEVSIRCGF
jgi:hypothetical protein